MAQDTDTQYGPFTSALTGPLTPHAQEDAPPIGYGGTAATLAQFANSFIRGAQQGQRTQYERSEAQKMQADRNFDNVMAHIQSDPTLSKAGKEAAHQIYLTQKYGRVAEGLKGADKSTKDHPVLNMVRAITGAVAGPGENKDHKLIDVNSLLSIATDPKYKIDPNAIGAKAASDLAESIGNIERGKPGVANPNLPAVPSQVQSETGAPVDVPTVTQIPGLALPGVAGREATANVVARDPDAQKALAPLIAQGIDPSTNAHTAPILSGLSRTPPPLVPHGVAAAVFGPDGKVEKYVDALRNSQGLLVDPITKAPIPGAVEATAGLASETRANNPTPVSLQKVWVKRPGSEDPEYAFINPKKLGGYIDVAGEKFPEGTIPVAAPTEGSGNAATFKLMATAQLARDGVQNPTREQLKKKAGDIAETIIGGPEARRRQEEAMDKELSGIGAPTAGSLFGGKAPTPERTPPPARTPPPGAATGASQLKPTAAPPTASGARPSASVMPKSEEDDAMYYMSTVLGTQKGGGKGGSVKSQRGEKILRDRTGLNPMELQSAIAEDQATKKALTEAVQVAGAFGRVQETLREHGQVLLDAAKAYGPGDYPIANRTLQWVQSNAGAHPELSKYLIAVNAVQREYGRLISGGVQSRAMLPVSAISQGESVIRPDATMKDIAAAVSQLKLEADTEQKAFSQQQNNLKAKLASGPIARAFSPSAANSGGKVTLTITGPDGKSTSHQYGSQEEANRIKATAPAGYTVK